MDRRTFLRKGFASSLFVGGSALWSSRALGAARRVSAGKARNVIFMVSDGMSAGTLSFTDQFIRWRDGRSSNWIRLYEEGKARRGMVDTASASSIVTDSSAGASAWGCGYRVNNGSVNIGPDGTQHPTIFQLAREVGKATGLVTTATATHATPAGFAANVEGRGEQPRIAEQYLERRIDLILGGGTQFFAGDRRADGRDLIGEFAGVGYGIARNRAELEQLGGADAPVLGLFADGYLPYDLDRLNDETLRREVPSLSEMTRFALDRLSWRPEGFVLQVEGGRVDHGAHANDIGGLVYDQIAFDEAIQVAAEFAEKHGDTLVIVTTDHGNANPGLSSGNDGGEKNFSALAGFRGTHQAILPKIDQESSAGAIVEAIRGATGLNVPEKDAELLRARLREEYRVPYRRMNSPGAVLGQILANHTDIGWVGNTHTSDHVEAAALGPGSEGLLPFQKNTDLFTLMTESLGIGARAKAGG